MDWIHFMFTILKKNNCSFAYMICINDSVGNNNQLLLKNEIELVFYDCFFLIPHDPWPMFGSIREALLSEIS